MLSRSQLCNSSMLSCSQLCNSSMLSRSQLCNSSSSSNSNSSGKCCHQLYSSIWLIVSSHSNSSAMLSYCQPCNSSSHPCSTTQLAWLLPHTWPHPLPLGVQRSTLVWQLETFQSLPPTSKHTLSLPSPPPLSHSHLLSASLLINLPHSYAPLNSQLRTVQLQAKWQ